LCACKQKPKIKAGFVSPKRGVFESNVFLRRKDGKGTEVYLVAKRLKSGGTLQPKDLLVRAGLHGQLGEKGLMIVKVFLGPKNHGFIAIDDEDDKIAIMAAVNSIVCLDELDEMDPRAVYNSITQVKLNKPIDLTKIQSSRNLLSIAQNPLVSCLDLHRLSQGFYPNPSTQKKGSMSDLLWQSATKDILSGKTSVDVKRLVPPGFLVTVDEIVSEEQGSVLSLYGTTQKIYVDGLSMRHDGGKVIYLIDPVEKTVKRQVRVLAKEQSRDIIVSPRKSSIRTIYGSTQDPTTRSPGILRFLTDAELLQAKEDILININTIRETLPSVSPDDGPPSPVELATSIACLSVLGVSNSQANLFNKIVGLSYLLIL
jgi:hypothetical protein